MKSIDIVEATVAVVSPSLYLLEEQDTDAVCTALRCRIDVIALSSKYSYTT